MTNLVKPPSAALAVGLALVALEPLPAVAQTPSSPPGTPAPAASGEVAAPDAVPQESPSPLRAEGGTQWSLFYGLGINQEINNSAAGIHVASGGVRWSHMWGLKGDGFLRGHPAFAIEGVPVIAFIERGRTTYASGFNLLYEHHFAARGIVLPVWKIGAGFLYASNPVPVGETRHNFSLLTSLGIDVMVTQGSAIFLGYRFHHVSNAGTGNVNPGINVHTVAFGVSFYR